jgi:hypothetical protein
MSPGSGFRTTPDPKEIFTDPCTDDHLLNSEEEVLPVLLRDGGQVCVGAGQVAPLPAAQVPAVLHHPDDKVIANLLYRVNQAHLHTVHFLNNLF